jgi:hypothetical protein
MQTPRTYRRATARCSFSRTLKSALVALGVATLPKMMMLVQHATFSRDEFKEFGIAAAVAALMVMFNYLQRLTEDERGAVTRSRLRRDRADEKLARQEQQPSDDESKLL